MAEETFREFVRMTCAELDTGKLSENEDIVDLTVDNNEMNTSLTGTINKYGCRSFQGNNIIDEELAMRTLYHPS